MLTAARYHSQNYSGVQLCCVRCDSADTHVVHGDVQPSDTHGLPGIRTHYTVLCRACGHVGEAVKREAA